MEHVQEVRVLEELSAGLRTLVEEVGSVWTATGIASIWVGSTSGEVPYVEADLDDASPDGSWSCWHLMGSLAAVYGFAAAAGSLDGGVPGNARFRATCAPGSGPASLATLLTLHPLREEDGSFARVGLERLALAAGADRTAVTDYVDGFRFADGDLERVVSGLGAILSGMRSAAA